MADLNPIVKIDRSYIDNFSVKDEVVNTLIPKYFPNSTISERNVGLMGLTSELLTNISEDNFNASSVYLRETFVNRAEIDECIYSHASIFQINNIFSTPGTCKFLMVFEESAILDAMEYNNALGIGYFYIDKSTEINVADYVYTFDYDIEIKCIKKKTSSNKSSAYLFSASYILPEDSSSRAYRNSISNITDPYIKVRISNDSLIALEVTARQYTRVTTYETILNNSRINFPVIDVNYSGKLGGFDVLYKSPTSSEFDTRLITLIQYSQPIAKPFCYYSKADENVLRISFNSKDLYFMPEYNSEIKIVLYITDGADANFDEYTGNDVSIDLDNAETYKYDQSFLMVAKAITGSTGGIDEMSIDKLQSLATRAYRTAMALTTESDLNEHFRNYKILYGDQYVKFFKKRDDVFERVFTGVLVLKDAYGNKYKTNTINLNCNLYDMENPENGIYTIKPGALFTYDGDTKSCMFLKNPDLESEYMKEYNNIKKHQLTKDDKTGLAPIDDLSVDDDIYFINIKRNESDTRLQKRFASFEQWKTRKGYNSLVTIYDDINIIKNFYPDKDGMDFSVYDDPLQNKFLYTNPFLIRFRKNPNMVNLYLTFANNTYLYDFTKLNESSFIQFASSAIMVNRTFFNTDRYLITTGVDSSSVGLTSPESSPLFCVNNDNVIEYPTLNQYKLTYKNHLRVVLVIYGDDNNPICFTEMYPTSIQDKSTILYQADLFTDDHISSDNMLRLNPAIRYTDTRENLSYYNQFKEYHDDMGNHYNRNEIIARYYKNPKIDTMYYDKYVPDENGVFVYKDSDTLESTLEEWSNSTNIEAQLEVVNAAEYVTIENSSYKCYYVQNIIDSTLFEKYDEDGNLLETVSRSQIEGFNQLIMSKRIYNMTKSDEIFIPITNVVCKVYTIYNRIYDINKVDNFTILRPIEDYETDNMFAEYDDSFLGYIWTNEYSTITDPITFVKPLNSCRSYLEYADWTSRKTEDTWILEMYEKFIINEFNNNPDNYSDISSVKEAYPLNEFKDENIDLLTNLYKDVWDNQIFDVSLYLLPLIKWDIAKDESSIKRFLNQFIDVYTNITDIQLNQLRQATGFDLKLYNTYGRANHFIIGEYEERLDMLNISIEFDIWYITGTDIVEATAAVKEYVKNEIETINDVGLNAIHVSNLTRKMELNFAYIDHIIFKGFNTKSGALTSYDTSYQTIKPDTDDINELDKYERRNYIPELLMVDIDDIIINEYTMS